MQTNQLDAHTFVGPQISIADMAKITELGVLTLLLRALRVKNMGNPLCPTFVQRQMPMASTSTKFRSRPAISPRKMCRHLMSRRVTIPILSLLIAAAAHVPQRFWP